MGVAGQNVTVVFTDGVLRISTPTVQARLRWQPEPSAEDLPVGQRKWQPFRPAHRLLRPPSSTDTPPDTKALAFAAFRETIPAPLVTAVERMASHQWAMLVLLHDQPRSMDLCRTNPVLAYCMANNEEFKAKPIAAARTQAVWYSHRKQRVILEWLGFPGTEAMARLIRRIPPESASPSMLRRLQNAIAHDRTITGLLAHLPTLNAGILHLVTQPRASEILTRRLLKEVAEDPAELAMPQAGDVLSDALAMLHDMEPGRALRRFAAVRQITEFHDAIMTEHQAHLRQQRDQMVARYQFPAPPVPGTPDIVPLTSAAQLRAEGETQRNCVGSYTEQVMSRRCYIYRVLAPERATLEIVWGTDGCWRRRQLKGKRNCHVSVATIRHVDEWLARYRTSV